MAGETDKRICGRGLGRLKVRVLCHQAGYTVLKMTAKWINMVLQWGEREGWRSSRQKQCKMDFMSNRQGSGFGRLRGKQAKNPLRVCVA